MYGTFLTNGKYYFHREDATDVASVLTKTAQLLALPFSQDILELCELRNILLTGNIPNFKFVNLKQIKSNQTGADSASYKIFVHKNKINHYFPLAVLIIYTASP